MVQGGDVKRGLLGDGSEGPALQEQVERHYFPERCGGHRNIFGTRNAA
jgi:hypothetical protein